MGHAGAIVSGSQGTAAGEGRGARGEGRPRRPHADRGRRDRRRDARRPDRLAARRRSSARSWLRTRSDLLRPRRPVARHRRRRRPARRRRRAPSQNDPAGTTAYGTVDRLPPAARVDRRAARRRARAGDRHQRLDAGRRVPVRRSSSSAGDAVVVERPTYDRTLLSLRDARRRRARRSTLETDGIDVDGARARCSPTGARPKLAHIIPNFQNPAGYTLSLEKRARAARAGRRARLHDLRGRPVRRRCASRGEPLPTMLVARRRPTTRRLRVVVLQDGLPRHPRRLPGRPGRR